jgi:dihydropteroate synthase
MIVRVLHRNTAYYKKRMQFLKVDSQGIGIMLPKTTFAVVEVGPLRSWQAQILKQKMLSLGSDAAVSRKSLIKDCQTSCMLFGTQQQLMAMANAMRVQPFGLPQVSRAILSAV